MIVEYIIIYCNIIRINIYIYICFFVMPGQYTAEMARGKKKKHEDANIENE